MKAFLVSLFFVCNSFAGSNHTKVEMPKEFSKMSSLVGKWEVDSKDGGEKSEVTYELTASNTTLMERLFSKTEHEMVTMYNAHGKTIAATHYCGLGNQPKMVLKKSDDKTMFFEMKGTEGIKSAKEPHMHSLKITFNDPTHITQEWTVFVEGKKKETKIINLVKK